MVTSTVQFTKTNRRSISKGIQKYLVQLILNQVTHHQQVSAPQHLAPPVFIHAVVHVILDRCTCRLPNITQGLSLSLASIFTITLPIERILIVRHHLHHTVHPDPFSCWRPTIYQWSKFDNFILTEGASNNLVFHLRELKRHKLWCSFDHLTG